MTGSYSYQIGTPENPDDLTVFETAQSGPNVIMRWNNNDSPGVTGFDIYFAPYPQPFENSLLLTEVTRSTELTTSNIPPGTWNFWIVARDIAGNQSLNPLNSILTVTNENTVNFTKNYVPCFSDQHNASFSLYAHFVRHWTGKMVPEGVNPCNTPAYDQKSPPNIGDITLDTVPGGDFDDTTYYIKCTFQTRSGETTPSAEVSIVVPAGFLPTVFIDISTWPGTGIGWNVYVDTVSGSETKQNADMLGNGHIDQIWQMPITGLVAGDALPTINQTGWDVFNIFVPECSGQFYFVPTNDLDTLTISNKRAWIYLELVPGPGETRVTQREGTPVFNILTDNSTPVTPFTLAYRTIIAQIPCQYVLPYIALQANQAPDGTTGPVCYINSFSLTVDS